MVVQAIQGDCAYSLVIACLPQHSIPIFHLVDLLYK